MRSEKKGGKTGRIVAIAISGVAIFAGVVMGAISLRIQEEIGAGQEQIAKGQQQLENSRRVFSLVPGGQQIGGGVHAYGQAKIARGESEIAYYQRLASNLMVAGVVLVILGGAGLIVSLAIRKSNNS